MGLGDYITQSFGSQTAFVYLAQLWDNGISERGKWKWKDQWIPQIPFEKEWAGKANHH